MPSISPLSDFRLGDKVALEQWLEAHNRRHVLYARKLSLKGGTLEGPVNGDWMLRHLARHLAIARDTKDKISTNMIQGLALPGYWKTPAELADWLQLHNRLHTRIERVHGIGGE